MFETRQGKIIGILLLVAAIGSALALLTRSFSGGPTSMTMVRWVACAFSTCGHSFKGEIADVPAVCPKCKNKTLWPAMRCSKCNGTVAVDTFRFNAERREPYCSKCGPGTLRPIRE